MEELNNTQGIEIVHEEGFDTVTFVNVGDGIVSISAVDQDGGFHNNILGRKQGAALRDFLNEVIGE